MQLGQQNPHINFKEASFVFHIYFLSKPRMQQHLYFTVSELCLDLLAFSMLSTKVVFTIFGDLRCLFMQISVATQEHSHLEHVGFILLCACTCGKFSYAYWQVLHTNLGVDLRMF